MPKHKVFFGRDGSIQFLHDDNLLDAVKDIGPADIRRFSHVETWSDLPEEARLAAVAAGLKEPAGIGWFYYVLGEPGTITGPFPRRDLAIAAEHAEYYRRQSQPPQGDL